MPNGVRTFCREGVCFLKEPQGGGYSRQETGSLGQQGMLLIQSRNLG